MKKTRELVVKIANGFGLRHSDDAGVYSEADFAEAPDGSILVQSDASPTKLIGGDRQLMLSPNDFYVGASTGQAGAFDVAHGLGREPTIAFIIPNVAEAGSIVPGTSTAVVNSITEINVNVTVTNGEKFRLIAF